MRPLNDPDEVEGREAIRQAAYELSRSGVCASWEEVWRALRTRFDVDQLAKFFENPLCRLDIDQRCYRARNPGRDAEGGSTDASDIRREVAQQRGATRVQIVEREMRKPCRLAARILEVLEDGSERTALELAQRLRVSRNDVFIAVRVMLANEALMVTGHTTAKHGGRGARVFACAATTAGQKNGKSVTYPHWPLAEPVVETAFDAIARRPDVENKHPTGCQQEPLT
jgi:hypothetical protein